MRKTLLLATALCLASAAMAQTNTSQSNAKEITSSGDFTTTVEGSTAKTLYWKFKADKDYVATINPYGGASLPEVIAGIANQIQGVSTADYEGKIYAFKQGMTYYFKMADVTGEVGFKLQLEETSNVGKGLSSDDPLTIELGKTQVFGDPLYKFGGWDDVNIYTTYTAEKDGQLRIKTEQSVSSATVNGTRVSAESANGFRTFKINTTAGETYNINFTIVTPFFIATSEVVEVKAGEIDKPFNLNNGECTVPAEAGKYYYTYTPEKKGFINISSDATLTDGQVKIFRNKLNANADNFAVAASEVGSYNVRTEITSTAYTYYIVVDKKQATTDAETFNFSFEEYQQGTTEDSPIPVTINETAGANITMPSAEGTYYYSINVPANTNKILLVEANSDLTSTSTVSLYKSGRSWNATKMSNGTVQTPVNSTTAATYILKVESKETSPLSFNISYADIEEGSLATSPKEAVAGENIIDFDGTEYYTYKATKSGKLAVTVADGVTVEFPEEAGSQSKHNAYQKGNVFFIEAKENTEYFITVSDVTKGSTFTLAETDFDKGEAFSNPIIMDGDTYVFDENTGNLWLKYNVTKTGIIDLSCDVPYNWNYSLNVTKKELSTTISPVSMVNQYSVLRKEQYGDQVFSYYESEYNYSGIIPVTAGEELYIQVNMAGDVSGKKLVLTQRDPEAGEAYSNPIIMEKGSTVDVSTASSTRGIFLKATLKKGDNIFRLVGKDCNIIPTLGCSENPDGITYDGQAAQWEEAQVGDETVYQFNLSVGNDMDIYIYINSVEGTPKLQFVDDSTDGISSIEAAQQDGAVTIYDLNGRMLNEISGNGVYIIKGNGQPKKVVIKK